MVYSIKMAMMYANEFNWNYYHKASGEMADVSGIWYNLAGQLVLYQNLVVLMPEMTQLKNWWLYG